MNAFFFFFQRSCHRCVYRTAGSSINIYYGGATNRYPVLWDIFFSSMQFAKNNKQQGLSDRKNCVSKHSKRISFMAVRVTHIAAIRMTLSDLLNPQNQAHKSHTKLSISLVYVYFTAKNNKMEGFFSTISDKNFKTFDQRAKVRSFDCMSNAHIFTDGISMYLLLIRAKVFSCYF